MGVDPPPLRIILDTNDARLRMVDDICVEYELVVSLDKTTLE